MRNSTLLPILIILLSLGSFTTLDAQSTTATTALSINVRLMCLSMNGKTISNLYILNDGKPQEIEAPSDFLSQPIDYKGPSLVAIYDQKPPPPTKLAPTPPFSPIAILEIPATFASSKDSECIVFFKYVNGALRANPMEFSQKTVPQGTYLFCNLSQRKLGVLLGEAKAIIPAGHTNLLSPGVEDNSYLPMYIYDEYEGSARRVAQSRHFQRASSRQLIFITDTDNPARVRLRIITQRIQPPPAPAASKDLKGTKLAAMTQKNNDR